MQINLSVFADRYLESIRACGFICPENADGLDIADSSIRLEARVESAHDPIWLRLVVNRQDDAVGLHFHVDAVRESAFDDELPTDVVSECELSRHLDVFRNKKIEFFPVCRFAVARAELRRQSVINLLAEVSVGPKDFEAAMIGATYDILSGPVDEVRWNISRGDDSEEMVFARISSESAVLLSEDLLATMASPAQSVFRAVILEEGVE